MIENFLGHLNSCLPGIKNFVDDWSDRLMASRIRAHVLYDVFKQTKPTVDKIKTQFNKSIVEYMKDNRSVKKMLDCSVLREEEMSAIGSACY